MMTTNGASFVLSLDKEIESPAHLEQAPLHVPRSIGAMV